MQNKCLGVFLVVVAFPLVILSIIFLSTGKLLESSFYKGVFRSSDSYTKVSKMLYQTTVGKNQTEDLTTFIIQNADGSWFKANVEKNLDEFFNYIKGQNASADLGIDLGSLEIQKNLAKNSEIPSEAVALIPDRLTFPSYVDFMKDLKNIYAQNANLAGAPEAAKQDVEMIDQQIQQGEELELKAQQNLANIKNGFQYFKLTTYIVYGLTLIILILIGVAARHFPPAIFKWTGEALIIPSAVLSILIYFGQKLALSTFNPFNLVKMSSEAKQLLMPIYITSLNTIYNDILKTTFIVGVIGLVLVIFSFILPKFIAKDANA